MFKLLWLVIKYMFWCILGAELAGCGSSTFQQGITGPNGMSSVITTGVIPINDARCPNLAGGIQYTTKTGGIITNVSFVCNGANGAPGTSSTIDLLLATSAQCPGGGEVLEVTSAGVSTTALVCNGLTPSTIGIQSFITPCGVSSSAFKEQLILLTNGSILADFSASSSALTVRLTLLPDSVYQDTDNSGCVFTVQTTGLTRSISWLGAVQKTWSIPNEFNSNLGQ